MTRRPVTRRPLVPRRLRPRRFRRRFRALDGEVEVRVGGSSPAVSGQSARDVHRVQGVERAPGDGARGQQHRRRGRHRASSSTFFVARRVVVGVDSKLSRAGATRAARGALEQRRRLVRFGDGIAAGRLAGSDLRVELEVVGGDDLIGRRDGARAPDAEDVAPIVRAMREQLGGDGTRHLPRVDRDASLRERTRGRPGAGAVVGRARIRRRPPRGLVVGVDDANRFLMRLMRRLHRGRRRRDALVRRRAGSFRSSRLAPRARRAFRRAAAHRRRPHGLAPRRSAPNGEAAVRYLSRASSGETPSGSRQERGRMTTIRRRSRARGGWYLGLFFISVGATDKCRDKTRSVDPHPLLESQPPVFREATRQAAGQARTVDCWVGVERSHAPPTRTFDRRFLPIHRAPHPKSIGQSTINHFSPALFRSVINIAPPNHGEIHLTSFPCQHR